MASFESVDQDKRVILRASASRLEIVADQHIEQIQFEV